MDDASDLRAINDFINTNISRQHHGKSLQFLANSYRWESDPCSRQTPANCILQLWHSWL